jgi:hypothetical protein
LKTIVLPPSYGFSNRIKHLSAVAGALLKHAQQHLISRKAQMKSSQVNVAMKKMCGLHCCNNPDRDVQCHLKGN